MAGRHHISNGPHRPATRPGTDYHDVLPRVKSTDVRYRVVNRYRLIHGWLAGRRRRKQPGRGSQHWVPGWDFRDKQRKLPASGMVSARHARSGTLAIHNFHSSRGVKRLASWMPPARARRIIAPSRPIALPLTTTSSEASNFTRLAPTSNCVVCNASHIVSGRMGALLVHFLPPHSNRPAARPPSAA